MGGTGRSPRRHWVAWRFEAAGRPSARPTRGQRHLNRA